ncbi:hypothetical protein QBC40DRAFT_228014 [Triangularia verruculosa]|uniref:Uncharacterized protein n=1 Tax=Triangularia verruculosa TaxID=2587418 RepID=A0AAN6XIX6_9PEZI|nr:hypothetical protein QBC40DRAFT_228014 [Triangularia verruculosa]
MADDLLFNLNLSSSESDPEDLASCPAKEPVSRADRSALSESAFNALKQSYIPRVENGELWSTIPLPLTPESDANRGGLISKPQAQDLLHAVEELYFYKRYTEAITFLERIMERDDQIDRETRELLRKYDGRCKSRLAEATQK